VLLGLGAVSCLAIRRRQPATEPGPAPEVPAAEVPATQ
jgi:hypothetical protein